jgi:hypothetical protein
MFWTRKRYFSSVHRAFMTENIYSCTTTWNFNREFQINCILISHKLEYFRLSVYNSFILVLFIFAIWINYQKVHLHLKSSLHLLAAWAICYVVCRIFSHVGFLNSVQWSISSGRTLLFHFSKYNKRVVKCVHYFKELFCTVNIFNI